MIRSAYINGVLVDYCVLIEIMFVRCLVIVCCAIIRLASGYYTASERGVLSGIFNDKPSTVLNQWIGPAEIDDGCEREYPLSPDNNRAVDLAYSRYNLVPQILPFSPPTYLEVMNLLEINRIYQQYLVNNKVILRCV